MEHSKFDPDNIPELDIETARQLLNNVFTECEVTPNTIPLETLESWGNYKKTEFKLGRSISYAVLVILVLLPLAFFKPTIIAQRTAIESSAKAVYRIEIKTLLPVSGVTVTLDGAPVDLQKENSKNYIASVPTNGTLQITATSYNGQRTSKTYEVAYIDMDRPKLISSHTEDGKVYLIVEDTYSGINYEQLSAQDAAGTIIAPSFVDEANNTIAFDIPDSPMEVFIPDNSGNILEILLSPTK